MPVAGLAPHLSRGPLPAFWGARVEWYRGCRRRVRCSARCIQATRGIAQISVRGLRVPGDPTYGSLGGPSQYLAGSPHISAKPMMRSRFGSECPSSMSVIRPRTMPVAVVFQCSA